MSVLRVPAAHLSLLAARRAGEAACAPVGTQAAWSRDMIVEEAARRDDEIESGSVKPLNEAQFWAGVYRRRP